LRTFDIVKVNLLLNYKLRFEPINSIVMKKYGLLLWFLISGSILFSQINYFSLSMGATVPTDKFAENTDARTTGYAESGFTMSFDGNYFLFDLFGISGTANFGMNFTDEVKLQDDWFDYINNLFQGVIIPPDATVDFNSTQWTYVNLMAGPIISIPVSRFFIELKAKAGLTFIKSPNKNLTVNFTNIELSSNASGQNLKFGYQFGGGILYMPNRTYGIRLGFDYFNSKANVDLESREDDGLGVPVVKTEVLHIPITAMHFTAGLAYSF